MTRKEYYQLLKAHHICPHCKQQDAYTLAGRTYCAECVEKDRTRQDARRQDPAERSRSAAANKARREARKAAGLCASCGKASPVCGTLVCAACREKRRRACERYRRAKGTQPHISGLCYRCNRETPIEGKRLCRSCYEAVLPITLENNKKAWGKPHPWRGDAAQSAREKTEKKATFT